MGKTFDLAAIMEQQRSAHPEKRTIEVITGEILELKKTAGDAILGIGQRLNEAKAMLSHGEWQTWLAERVEFSERSAQRFMRLAREWSNPTALSDLGATKALTLLALPPEEREQFMAESHQVDGAEKTVIDMSARELEKAIRERDEAEKRAQELLDSIAEQKKELSAENERLRKELQTAQDEAVQLKEAEAETAGAAQVATETAARLAKELEELKAAPVDVAVMAVDQAKLDQARAEAMAEMQAKLDKAKEAKAKADEKRKAAEAALEQAQVQLKDSEQARKNAVLTSDEDIAMFKAFFQQTQENANKMRGILLKLRGRTDHTAAQGAEKALKALAEAIARCAE